MPHDGTYRRVIVADDEGAIAETMALILNAHGYNARPVSSGEAAVEMAGEFHPDFLISDIRMGTLDGIEAAIRVCERCPDCKVLVFSASIVSHETHDRLRKLGFDFLRKPIHPSILLAHLHKAHSAHSPLNRSAA
jgi:DNA-binding response OmpR family regulator